MKNIFFLFLFIFCFPFLLRAQDSNGYWDNQRITNKEISLAAGEKIIIKSEDLPIGTTEFVYRITLLDQNQKMASDLSSVLKAIPDPYFIGKGAGGAIALLSNISGTDKCTYAIFTNPNKANDFSKSGKFTNACLYQSVPVSKDAKLLTINKSTCLQDTTQNIWFAFKSENWLLGQKIVLEIVPWVNKKAAQGWTKSNKNTVVNYLKTTNVATKLPQPEIYCIALLQKIQEQYSYTEFKNLSQTEKQVILSSLQETTLQETNMLSIYRKKVAQQAKQMAQKGDTEKAIQLINTAIIDKSNPSALDYNALADLYILSKQFDKSLAILKKAAILDPSELLVQLNLAHTYMFLDQITMAKNIHQKYCTQNVLPNQTWKNKTINDLDTFGKMQLPNDNFKKILRIVTN